MINEVFGFIKKLLGIGMPCAFHSLTGLYCPGCGGTRAVRELLYGDLRMSFPRKNSASRWKNGGMN